MAAGKASGDALFKNLAGIEAIAIYYSEPGGKMEIPAERRKGIGT
jgi:hypothetical protein